MHKFRPGEEDGSKFGMNWANVQDDRVVSQVPQHISQQITDYTADAALDGFITVKPNLNTTNQNDRALLLFANSIASVFC